MLALLRLVPNRTNFQGFPSPTQSFPFFPSFYSIFYLSQNCCLAMSSLPHPYFKRKSDSQMTDLPTIHQRLGARLFSSSRLQFGFLCCTAGTRGDQTNRKVQNDPAEIVQNQSTHSLEKDDVIMSSEYSPRATVMVENLGSGSFKKSKEQTEMPAACWFCSVNT